MKREKELYLDWCAAEKNLEEISLEAYSHDLDLFFSSPTSFRDEHSEFKLVPILRSLLLGKTHGKE